MRPALADFRIESEAVIRLSFADGKTYRVNPNDLERYVGREDLTAIQRALQLRKQFIRRVLPISLMVFLVASMIGLASHDASRIQAMLHPRLQAAHTVKSVKALPVSAPAKPSAAASSTGQSVTGSGSAITTTTPAAATAAGASTKAGAAPVTPSSAKPAATTAKPVTTPITTAKPIVQQVVSPVVQTAKTVLGKLLP